jgi:AraC-like DNA-binding protein
VNHNVDGDSRVIHNLGARLSDAPFVELIWNSRSEGSGSFMSAAFGNLEMVVTEQEGRITFSIHGPFTRAFPAPVPEDAEFLGIAFKLGTFMPNLPPSQLIDKGVSLPEAAGKSFWLQGSAWQFPNFENADTFVERLVRYGLLAYDPIVQAALQGQQTDLSERSIQRRFRRITGMAPGALYQIERARRAMQLLQQGVSILDTVEQAGYYDQPHLTRSLKYLMGQTPAQIAANMSNE